MNVLPFILAFLLILSFSSYTLFKDFTATQLEAWGSTGYLQTEREARGQSAEKLYRLAKKTNGPRKKKNADEKGKGKKRTFKSRRSHCVPLEEAKLNLAFLLTTAPSSSSYAILYETAATLIRTLYNRQPFWKEGIERPLLDEMIRQGKAHPQAATFGALFPENKELAELFYILLKGTQSYNLETLEGIPIFSDFFLIDSTPSEKPIYFCFASLPLLSALFGPEITHAITEEEQKKWEQKKRNYTLKRTELEDLLTRFPNTKYSFEQYKELMNFSIVGQGRKMKGVKDPNTGILTRREL